MHEDIYELYKTNEDFKDYVDKFCVANHLGIFEAFNIKMVKNYELYLREKGGQSNVLRERISEVSGPHRGSCPVGADS